MRTSSAAKSAVRKASRRPLPPKIAAVLRESWWLLLVGAALYLVLVLATYSKSDPGWSHQASGSQVVNAGGKAGAWIADLRTRRLVRPSGVGFTVSSEDQDEIKRRADQQQPPRFAQQRGDLGRQGLARCFVDCGPGRG